MLASTAEATTSDRGRSPLRPLVATTFLIYFGWGLTAPVLPLFARDLGAGEAAVGMLVASFSVASFCFDIAGGRISDRVGARRAATGGAFLVGLAGVLAAFAPGFAVLLLSRLLAGIGSAFYVTTAMNVIARTTAPERMGRSMSIYQGAILSSMAIGPAIGGLLAELVGFRLPFALYGLCAFLCVIAAWRTLPARLPHPAKRAGGGDAFAAVLRDGAFITALAVAFAVFIMRAGVTSTTVPLYANEDLGLSQALVGLALTVSAIANLVWLPSAGRLADQRPRRVATMLGLVLALAGLALLASGSGPIGLYVAMLLTGSSTAFAGGTPAAIISDVAPPAQSGTALGMYRMAVDGASIVAPISAGIIAATAGYRAVFLTFMLPLLLVLAASSRLRDTRRRATVSSSS
jgi:MFS transporter, DHA1 family, multidrug resistance protein